MARKKMNKSPEVRTWVFEEITEGKVNSIGKVLTEPWSTEFVEEGRGWLPKDSHACYFRYNGKSWGKLLEEVDMIQLKF